MKYILVIMFMHLGTWNWETDNVQRIEYKSKTVCEKEAIRIDKGYGMRAFCVEVK